MRRNHQNTENRSINKTNLTLWIIQGLLAALFLFAGSMKFIMPIEVMTKEIHLSGSFLHFIGVCEIIGALGLVLPGAFKVRPELTSLAAGGLVVVMIGATSLTLTTAAPAGAVVPFIVGLLAAFVAVGRIQIAPYRGSSIRLVLHAAN